MARKIYTVFSAVFVIACAVSRVAHGALIHESATLGPTGIAAPYSSINGPTFRGSRFSVDTAVKVESVGGHFVGSPTHDASLFAAIFSLSSSTALPAWEPLDMPPPLATAVFYPPWPSAEVFFPVSVTLSPGHYLVLFGSDFFGSHANLGGMPGNDVTLPGQESHFVGFSYFTTPGWVSSSASSSYGYRVVVTGTVIPEPGTWFLTAFATFYFIRNNSIGDGRLCRRYGDKVTPRR
jgi:hypothetical protein